MTQRVPNTIADQYIYFMARDSSGNALTGLTSFTVYRSRDGGTATAYTTPTITEVSSANMPGVYKFLIDEDTTVTSGDNVNMQALYITQASMVPVFEVIEIYRTVVSAGQTLAVATSNISALNANTITAASIAADAITDAKVASDVTIASVTGSVGSVTGAVGSVTGNVGGNVTGSVGSVTGAVGSVTGNVGGSVASVTAAVTLPTIPANWITANGIAADAIGASEIAADAITEIQAGLATAASIAALNNISEAGVRTAVGLASANLDTQLGSISTDTTTDIPAQIAALNNLSSADVTAAVPSAADITNATWAEVIESGYSATEILRLLAAYAVGTATGLNGSAAFKGIDGTTTRITGTVDGVNRTITALDAT